MNKEEQDALITLLKIARKNRSTVLMALDGGMRIKITSGGLIYQCVAGSPVAFTGTIEEFEQWLKSE